jgi:predicted RNase H-like nuclease (RuvC/YqgF family)
MRDPSGHIVYYDPGDPPEDDFDALTREREELRAEVERLQRENGALARAYAACEKMLRERTEQLNEAEVEGFVSALVDEKDRTARLRAALTEMLESFTEPEDDNDILRRARAALR